jgi:hypothetical protein
MTMPTAARFSARRDCDVRACAPVRVADIAMLVRTVIARACKRESRLALNCRDTRAPTPPDCATARSNLARPTSAVSLGLG